MTPLLTSQTRLNILTALDWLGVHHEIIFSDDPLDNQDRSRVKAFDPHGLILRRIKEHPAQWHRDSGSNHSAHGYRVTDSWRSNTTPSLQLCKVNAVGGEYDYFFEIDLDENSPFVNFPAHTWECLRNMGPNTTDPAKIAAMLRVTRAVKHQL